MYMRTARFVTSLLCGFPIRVGDWTVLASANYANIANAAVPFTISSDANQLNTGL